jgi:hypothetical protein
MHHTREIPRDGWVDFLTLVSNVERDHHVRIQAAGPDLGDQMVASSLPLVDISVEERGEEPSVIEVMVGRPGESITHRILHPQHVYAEESDRGDIECLDIEDVDHVKTLIYFEPQLTREEGLSQQL